MLVVSTLYAFFVFLILFAVCELGERTGNIFIELDYEIGQLDWYLFPMNIQKMLPTLMANSQKPVVFNCFGSVACTRWQFQKVYVFD